MSDMESIRMNQEINDISLKIGLLASTEHFQDVELVTEDGVLRSNKLLLSACSEILRQIVLTSKNPASIFLDGFRAQDVENLLDLLTHGRLDIDKMKADDFMAKISSLKISGVFKKSDVIKEDVEYTIEDEEWSYGPLEDGRYQCFICQKTLQNKPNAHRHFQILHVTKREIECQICKEISNSLDELKRHNMEKHKIKQNCAADQCYISRFPNGRFQCLICFNMLSTKSKARHHLVRNHNVSGKYFDQQFCGERPTESDFVKVNCSVNEIDLFLDHLDEGVSCLSQSFCDHE